jgi:hypothetical protein
MVRTVGNKNKRVVKKVVPKKIFRKIEIDFDDETEQKIDVSMRPSVPLGDLQDRTEGWQPRSRSAESREAGFRSKQDRIDYFTRSITAVQKGRTYLPESITKNPEYTYMWAREQVRDRYDGHNLRNLENIKGWEYVDSSEIPELGFYSATGDVQDSAGRIRDGGLILMKRYREIHNMELSHQQSQRNQQSRMQQLVRTINSELHPFATGAINHNSAFFPSDPHANAFSETFR